MCIKEISIGMETESRKVTQDLVTNKADHKTKMNLVLHAIVNKYQYPQLASCEQQICHYNKDFTLLQKKEGKLRRNCY